MREKIQGLLKEPLVHFLLAGLALFGFFALRGEEADPESRTITITAEQVERLAANWAQTWQRAPTQAEIDGLIRDYVKEEVYYREALRLGLDQDDTVIRRRLRAKMEFLANAQLETAKPDDAQLQALIDKNPDRYAADARYSFDQIYLGAQDEAKAARLSTTVRQQLKNGTAWNGLGERISLPPSLDKADREDIARDFGAEFADALGQLKPGEWSEPIKSGFGFHLVRIRVTSPGTAPKLAEIRQQVENDWRATTGKAREAKAYQTLLDGYTIRIAKP